MFLKLKIVCFFIIYILLCTPMFADIGIVNFRITANLVKTTCVADSASLSKVIKLGEWSSRALSINGTKPIPFDIILLDCPANVRLQFDGAPDPLNNELYLLNAIESTAKNVAIAILDVDKNRVPPKTNNQGKPVDESTDKKLKFQFYGQYIPTGKPVSGGVANANISFSLIYD